MSALKWPRLVFSAARLVDVLAERGMDAATLARETRQPLSRIEGYLDDGVLAGPPTWLFARIALVLDMSMDELFAETFCEVGR